MMLMTIKRVITVVKRVIWLGDRVYGSFLQKKDTYMAIKRNNSMN